MHRRTLLKGAVAGALLPLFAASGRTSPPKFSSDADVRIMIAPDSTPPVYGDKGKEYIYRLGLAALEYTDKCYSGSQMPIWGKRPDEVDLEKRTINIAYWVGRGVAENHSIYPLDPAWIMAQIMAESLFYEFAVSWAFAVGVCQFIPPTAAEYGLSCADKTELPESALRLPHLAGELDRYYALQKRLSRLKLDNPLLYKDKDRILKRALEALHSNEEVDWAGKNLHILGEEEKLDENLDSARKNYTRFLQANFQDRDIFSRGDLDFLLRFDQRVTYKAPIQAMTKMMAQHLKKRQGNVLTATAGYNAGLGHTRVDSRIYGPYGLIPSFEQTVTYVSRIAVNHHEIVSRL
ncbi:MAG: transglycosylase SLT domain-containing protein [Desulfonatronovibrionaceae bacterium]